MEIARIKKKLKEISDNIEEVSGGTKKDIAIGISGAAQHIVGMKDSEFIVSINPDPDAPIKDESDVYIQGRMENVLPALIDSVKKLKSGK